MRTDSEIQQAVLDELRWDSRVSETEVGAEVDQGVVTLTGTVSSYAKRVAAQEAAHRVAGERDAANGLKVQPQGRHARSDTAIALAVRHAPQWNVLVPDERIETTVTAGWATLSGSVSYGQERAEAERAVRHLAGVQGVTNAITLDLPRGGSGRCAEGGPGCAAAARGARGAAPGHPRVAGRGRDPGGAGAVLEGEGGDYRRGALHSRREHSGRPASRRPGGVASGPRGRGRGGARAAPSGIARQAPRSPARPCRSPAAALARPAAPDESQVEPPAGAAGRPRGEP